MRILVFNLVMDVNHPILGFTTRWIEALAHKTEHVYVVTMYAGKVVVPSNVQVYSVGRERGYSKQRRVLNFYKHLFHILRNERVNACFSHMIPILSILAAPILRPLHIPIITWFAHPSLTRTLKIAHFLSNRMVSSVPNAYPYKEDKLTVIGQGIDTNLFAPDGTLPDSPPFILCVGRLSPVKGHPTLLDAVAKLRRQLFQPFNLFILGQPVGAEGTAYVNRLHSSIRQLGIQDIVHFQSAVPMVELPRWYRRCEVHVNLTPVGFGDKVAWEAMSCGRPCLVANTDFRETLGKYVDRLLFQYQDAEDLAQRLHWLLSLSSREREHIGAYLRDQVIRLHSLDSLTNKLLNVAKSVHVD